MSGHDFSRAASAAKSPRALDAAEKGLLPNGRREKHTPGAKEAAEKPVISVESGEKARPRLKPVLILLALCGG